MAIVGTFYTALSTLALLPVSLQPLSIVLDSDLPQFVETTELCLASSLCCHLEVLKGRKPGDCGPHFVHFSKIQTDVSYVMSSFIIVYHQLLRYGSHFVLQGSV